MKAVKIVGYVAWFFAAFVVGVYFTLPVDEFKGMIVSGLEDKLGKGKQGAYGVDPKVEIGSMSMSGFGIKASSVKIQLASRDPEPGPTIDLEKVHGGVRPWTLLSKSKTVTFGADGYGGSVDGVLSIDDKGAVTYANIDADDIDLARFTLVAQKLGVPVGGKVKVRADLDLGPTPEKDGEGEVKLDVKGLTVGPGNLKLAAAFGGFELPLIDLGSMSGEIPVKQGKGTLQNVKLDGKDIQAELVGEVFPKGRLDLSRLDVDGWFQPMPAFLEREKKLQSLLELGESLGGGMGGGMSLSKAKDDEGHYWFGLKGTLTSPSALLARDAGKRAKGKVAKGSTTGTTGPVTPPTPSTPKPTPAPKYRPPSKPAATPSTDGDPPPEAPPPPAPSGGDGGGGDDAPPEPKG